MLDEGDRYHGNWCPYFREFRRENPESASVILQNATHMEVKPNKSNSLIAIKKNDHKRVYPSHTDEFYLSALNHSWRKNAVHYVRPPLSAQDGSMQFSSGSSSGIIGKKTGFPKTKDFLDSQPFKKYKDNISYVPIKIINFKNEFLHIEDDLEREKIRLVDAEDKAFIYKQKGLYDNQNHSLIENSRHSPIKYGMVKQYAGFSYFIMSFECCCLISVSDISGYDKSAVLDDVYAMRNHGLSIATRGVVGPESSLVQYVTYYTLNPVRLWVDGNVLLQDHSNSSGQNNTTSDNCFLHDIIINDLALTCFYEVYGRFPFDDSEFDDSFVYGIYSDDKVFGLKYDMDASLFKEIETRTYSKYGMTIKASASRVIPHISGTRFTEEDGIEFLGGTAIWCPEADEYLPRPRVGKLMTSLSRHLNDEERLSPFEQYNKIYSIYELLLCVEPAIKRAVCAYLIWMLRVYSQDLCFFREKRFDVEHLYRMSEDDLANAGEILGWERS